MEDLGIRRVVSLDRYPGRVVVRFWSNRRGYRNYTARIESIFRVVDVAQRLLFSRSAFASLHSTGWAVIEFEEEGK